MNKRLNRIYSVIILALIVVYGILRIWVQKLFGRFLIYLASVFNVEENWVFQVFTSEANNAHFREQKIGWIIYYPTYFLLHILFIYVLFNNQIKTRNILIIGLTVLVSSIVLLWIVFLNLGMLELAVFFKYQFKNLFGLPFILLIIEGGRILYLDLIKLSKLKDR